MDICDRMKQHFVRCTISVISLLIANPQLRVSLPYSSPALTGALKKQTQTVRVRRQHDNKTPTKAPITNLLSINSYNNALEVNEFLIVMIDLLK